MRKKDIPSYIKASAVAMAITLNELGYGGDKTSAVIDRGNKFTKDTETGDALPALGDDLAGWSVAVGFAVALGVFASCVGAADIKKQMQNAELS